MLTKNNPQNIFQLTLKLFPCNLCYHAVNVYRTNNGFFNFLNFIIIIIIIS